jgi:septal ring factor EnvC (AmiA/AmiB activator)
MTMMQMSQSDMLQQISQLQENLNQVVHELTETKKRQAAQQQMIKDMMDFMSKQYGTACKYI